MAAAYDAVSGLAEQGFVTTGSWSHTTSGANRAILIGNGNRQGGNAQALTAATYNSVSATVIQNYNYSSLLANIGIAGLIAPASGNNTVTATIAGSTNDQCFVAISATGIDQTTAWGSTATNNGSSAAASVTGVPSASGDLVVGFNFTSWTDGTADSPATTAISQPTFSANRACMNLGYYLATGSSTDMSFTKGTSGEDDLWGVIGIALKVSGGGGGSTFPMPTCFFMNQ